MSAVLHDATGQGTTCRRSASLLSNIQGCGRSCSERTTRG